MHSMPRRLSPLLVALLALELGAQPSNPCLQELTGSWAGNGQVLNRAVLMTQRWKPAIQGAFIEQEMSHRVPTDTAKVVFGARAFYRAGASGQAEGTWFDARGITFRLNAICAGSSLSVAWDGASERGRTIYTLEAGPRLTVIDSVLAGNTWREFGRSTLSRVAP